MGQVVKQVTANTRRAFWYPGDGEQWLRAVAAVLLGGFGYLATHLLIHGTLVPAVVGTSVAAGMAGLNYGRRDARALARLVRRGPQGEQPRRRHHVAHTRRAVWRALVEGTGGAVAALIIVNLPPTGVVADWLLPLVPAAVAALAHQIGMTYERLGITRAIPDPVKRPMKGAVSAPAPPVPPVPPPFPPKPALAASGPAPDTVPSPVTGATDPGSGHPGGRVPSEDPRAGSAAPEGRPRAQTTAPGGRHRARADASRGGRRAEITAPAGWHRAKTAVPGDGPRTETTASEGGWRAGTTPPGGGPRTGAAAQSGRPGPDRGTRDRDDGARDEKSRPGTEAPDGPTPAAAVTRRIRRTPSGGRHVGRARVVR